MPRFASRSLGLLAAFFALAGHSARSLQCQNFLSARPTIVATITSEGSFSKQRQDNTRSSGSLWYFSDFTIWSQYLVSFSKMLGEIRFYDLRNGELVIQQLVRLSGETASFTDGTYDIYQGIFDHDGGFYAISKSGKLFHAYIGSIILGHELEPHYNIAERAQLREHFNPAKILVLDDPQRAYVQVSPLRERDVTISGVFNLIEGKWLRSFNFPSEGYHSRDFRMSPDGKSLFTYTTVQDNESAARSAAQHFQGYNPHQIDLKSQFPKALIDADTGLATPVTYPEEFNEQLNTRYVAKIQFTSQVGVLRAILRRENLVIDFEAATGKILHKRSVKTSYSGTYVSPDGNLLLRSEESGENNGVQALDTSKGRARLLADFPKSSIYPTQYLADREGFYLVVTSASGFTIYRTNREGVLGDVKLYEAPRGIYL
jgi:hypothetical protein